MPQLLTTTLNGGIDPGISGTGERASYAMVSYNTSSGTGGYALYDSNWCNPVNYGDYNGFNYYGASDAVYASASTLGNYNSMFYNATGTQTSPSSNSTNSYMNATPATGEFGNALVDIYSDGTFGQAGRMSGTWNNKHYLNINAINSDHSDKRNVYLLINNRIRCVDRLYGSYNYAKAGTADYVFPSPVVDSNMSGSASYHAGRKELTVLSYVTSGGSFNVYTFQNVDFNLYPNPNVALNRPEVVRVNATLSLASNWSVNNNESYYNLKPITTDNGKVYVVVFFTSNTQTLYEFTRSGTNPITGTYITAQSLTTSYGREQGYPQYGQRQITSRDGTSVCVFCPYYYYGSGLYSFMIDKTNNTYGSYGYGDTGYGHFVTPFGNSGWNYIYAGNAYSSNYTGSYIAATYEKAVSGGFTQTGSTRYFTKFTYPNTTNYPGYTHVVDYNLLTGNPVGVKLAR